MDTEKSSSSSFEDLTNAEDTKDIRKVAAEEAASGDGAPPASVSGDGQKAEEEDAEEECDILGNKQLIKRTIKKAPEDSFRRPIRGELVTVNFTGKLDNGTVVENELNFQCHVGDYEVIQGLDMVLPMLQVGEVSQVSVDSRFGYGSLGLKKEGESEYLVPPDAHVSLYSNCHKNSSHISIFQLTYEIELLDIKYEEFADLKSFDILRKYGYVIFFALLVGS